MPGGRSRRSRRGRTSGLDIHSNPYKYFSHKLNLDPKGDNIEAIVDDFNYLRNPEIGSPAEGAAIVLLRQFGYEIDKSKVKEGDELDTYLETMKPTGSNKLSEYLFIELSTKNTYSLRGKNIGHYEEALEGGSMPCMYPFPCSNHILKFNHNGKPVYFPPIVDRPENNNNNIPDQAYVQVYTVNGKDYVHHSTGLVENRHKGGRRRTVRRSSRRSR